MAEKPDPETCQHHVEGIYHGRTELGVGQHDRIKSRLNQELHTDYGDYLVKEESDRIRKIEEDGQPQKVYGYESSTGSAADIGYESAMSIVNKRKQLNEDRRAEYEAHLAAKSGQRVQVDGSGDASQMSTEDAQEESTMVSPYGSSESFESFDEPQQKQFGYADSLREQIAEKRITDQMKKEQDRGQYMNFESASMKGFSGSSQSSEKEELDERTQKQQDYAEALREQIAEKKKITDGIKKKQDFDDERSELSHVGSHHFNSESRSMKGFSGSSQTSEQQDEFDSRRQKQQEYAEALRQQIAEKKSITDRIKNIQRSEDDRKDRTDEENSKPVPHYFNSESPVKRSGYPANSEIYGQEEMDERRQKQQNYADALRDQIAEKKTIMDGIKKREDEEDEKNEERQGGGHDYHSGNGGY